MYDVNELREVNNNLLAGGINFDDVLPGAAVEIERLRVENERLRGLYDYVAVELYDAEARIAELSDYLTAALAIIEDEEPGVRYVTLAGAGVHLGLVAARIALTKGEK